MYLPCIFCVCVCVRVYLNMWRNVKYGHTLPFFFPEMLNNVQKGTCTVKLTFDLLDIKYVNTLF